MELFLIVLRNIFIAIAIIYAVLLIVSISFVTSFASILSHHNNDLSVILTNKRDVLVTLSSLLSNDSIKLDKKQLDALVNFDIKRIENQSKEDAKKARDELTSLSEYLLLKVSENNKENASDEYRRVMENIQELDNVYRQRLMMYNADVLGYNFWISFFPTRFVFKIFRLKKKDTI